MVSNVNYKNNFFKLDARDGIEPSIVLLQRTVLPFDHPAII